MTEFLTENIWEIITSSVKQRTPNYVAVAYFGTDGANLLPLKKGDILVVDASEITVKNGGTDPKSLHILLDKGVRIFSKERLHAKVMVLGGTVFVGSANVSSNSKYVLHEAVIQTNDPKLVEECKQYILDLPKKELHEKELKYLTSIYSPPTSMAGKKKHRVANSQFRIYSLEIERMGYSKGIEKILKKGKEIAEEELGTDELLDIIELKIDETTASLEFILKMEKREKGWFVYPPMEIIHKERIEDKRVVLLFLGKKKGLKGMYKEMVEKKINREIPGNQWISEVLSKKIMEQWKMTFN